MRNDRPGCGAEIGRGYRPGVPCATAAWMSTARAFTHIGEREDREHDERSRSSVADAVEDRRPGPAGCAPLGRGGGARPDQCPGQRGERGPDSSRPTSATALTPHGSRYQAAGGGMPGLPGPSGVTHARASVAGR